jgi:hypothetical protein
MVSGRGQSATGSPGCLLSTGGMAALTLHQVIFPPIREGYQFHSLLRASTSWSPRPCSSRELAAPRTGGTPEASHTSDLL